MISFFWTLVRNLDLTFIKMILKREIGIGQLTDVQTSEIDYITRMKAMPFDLYSKKVRPDDNFELLNDLMLTIILESSGEYWLEE